MARGRFRRGFSVSPAAMATISVPMKLQGRRAVRNDSRCKCAGRGDVREGSLGEDGPESEELSERARDALVLSKGSGVPPVGESEVTLVSSSGVDDDTDEDQTDNGEDLDGGEPELGFTVTLGSEHVDADDDDKGDGDPDGIVDGVRHGLGPVLDKDGNGSEFDGENDCGGRAIVRRSPGSRCEKRWARNSLSQL